MFLAHEKPKHSGLLQAVSRDVAHCRTDLWRPCSQDLLGWMFPWFAGKKRCFFVPSRITTKLSRVSGDSGFAIFMCAPWIIVRFVSNHIPASRLVKMTDFDWVNHPYYWFTIGKSRINMWVCVCAQHVRGQTWTARKFVFFAGYPPIKYGLLANIIGTLIIKKISMGLHFAWKSQKKLGLSCMYIYIYICTCIYIYVYVYHSPKFEVSNFSIYLEEFTMSQHDDPSGQRRNQIKHRFLRLFPISGTSKIHFSGWWLIYYNPQYYNII